jgi:hypothetical protein
LVDRNEVPLFGQAAELFVIGLNHGSEIKRAISGSPMALDIMHSFDGNQPW